MLRQRVTSSTPTTGECRLQARKCFALILVLALTTIIGQARAQESAPAEVHIVPRTRAADSVVPNHTDSLLQTHTKPIVKDVDLVLLPITITDGLNRPVAGMTKENFRVYDSGIPQSVEHFSTIEAPISIAVILDMSGSMEDKLRDAREALADFFDTTNPQDEFLVITFADKPEVLVDFTTDVETVLSQLLYRQGKGQTALIDAIYLAMSKMKHAKHARKAILVISDGGDNHSRYSVRDIKNLVREADTQIYAIGLYNYALGTAEEYSGPELLNSIATLSGGRAFTVCTSLLFKPVAEQISILLRHQYFIGYKPSKVPRDGKWHKVKIKLLLPKGSAHLSIAAKRGYYAPRQR